MKNPKITVYVISHNYGAYLEGAVESVLRQSAEGWELLIIDDGSTDNTQQVMNLYKGDERIRLFKTTGIGLPAVCNLALNESKGKYLIRLDGDDLFDENLLLVLGNYLDKHQDVAMVFPDYYLIDEFGEIYSEKRRQKISKNNHLLDAPANGACTLIRKQVLKQVGGYREDLGAQDGYDIWSKIVLDYKCANINLPLFYYRRHGQNLTNNLHHILAARRRIKIDTISKQLSRFQPIIAVIPCRRNFDFCIDLWKQKINGKSLLQRDIESCITSKLLDHIVVASDNPEVNEVIGLFDDPRLIYFERQREDTIRSTKLVITLEKIAMKLDPQFRGITAVSYLQTPFVGFATMEEAISTLIMNEADCALGVKEIKDPLYKRMAHGLQAVNPPKDPSTDFDVIYQESSTFLATRNKNFKTGSLTGPCIVNFTVSPEECFFVDSEMNLEIARKIQEHKLAGVTTPILNNK